MERSMDERVRELMRGAYDLHVHAAPSHTPRALDDFELARQMDLYGMAGAVTKSHYDPTAGRAAIANKYSGAASRLYGAVALNRPAGGLNPYAARSALELGAKIVWLPTRDVKQGLRAVGDGGEPLPEIYEIFEVVKSFSAWLATGHIKPEESRAVCLAGLERGVNMILTHPDSKSTWVPLEVQTDLASRGVMVEKAWGNVYNGYISAREMAESIRLIGPDRVFMVTDFGQADSPLPAQGMHDFIAAMLSEGISPDAVDKMVRANPRRILGLTED